MTQGFQVPNQVEEATCTAREGCSSRTEVKGALGRNYVLPEPDGQVKPSPAAQQTAHAWREPTREYQVTDRDNDTARRPRWQRPTGAPAPAPPRARAAQPCGPAAATRQRLTLPSRARSPRNALPPSARRLSSPVPAAACDSAARFRHRSASRPRKPTRKTRCPPNAKAPVVAASPNAKGWSPDTCQRRKWLRGVANLRELAAGSGAALAGSRVSSILLPAMAAVSRLGAGCGAFD